MNPYELPEEDSFPEKNGILWTCKHVNNIASLWLVMSK